MGYFGNYFGLVEAAGAVGSSGLAVTLSGGTLTATAADTWSIALTGLGSLEGIDELFFVIKAKISDLDADAQLFVSQSTGLVRLLGVLVENEDSPLASITIDDAEAGDITINVDEVATALIGRVSLGHFAVKRFRGGDAVTLLRGTFQARAASIAATE